MQHSVIMVSRASQQHVLACRRRPRAAAHAAPELLTARPTRGARLLKAVQFMPAINQHGRKISMRNCRMRQGKGAAQEQHECSDSPRGLAAGARAAAFMCSSPAAAMLANLRDTGAHKQLQCAAHAKRTSSARRRPRASRCCARRAAFGCGEMQAPLLNRVGPLAPRHTHCIQSTVVLWAV